MQHVISPLLQHHQFHHHQQIQHHQRQRHEQIQPSDKLQIHGHHQQNQQQHQQQQSSEQSIGQPNQQRVSEHQKETLREQDQDHRQQQLQVEQQSHELKDRLDDVNQIIDNKQSSDQLQRIDPLEIPRQNPLDAVLSAAQNRKDVHHSNNALDNSKFSHAYDNPQIRQNANPSH